MCLFFCLSLFEFPLKEEEETEEREREKRAVSVAPVRSKGLRKELEETQKCLCHGVQKNPTHSGMQPTRCNIKINFASNVCSHTFEKNDCLLSDVP